MFSIPLIFLSCPSPFTRSFPLFSPPGHKTLLLRFSLRGSFRRPRLPFLCISCPTPKNHSASRHRLFFHPFIVSSCDFSAIRPSIFPHPPFLFFFSLFLLIFFPNVFLPPFSQLSWVLDWIFPSRLLLDFWPPVLTEFLRCLKDSVRCSFFSPPLESFFPPHAAS